MGILKPYVEGKAYVILKSRYVYVDLEKYTAIYIYIYLNILFIFREGKGVERKEEKHQCVVVS